MKKQFLFLLVIVSAADISGSNKKNFITEYKTNIALGLCAGGVAFAGNAFTDNSFLSTTISDASTALSLYIGWKALTHRSEEQELEKKETNFLLKTAAEVCKSSISVTASASFPLAYLWVADSQPAFIGDTWIWSRCANWIRPQPPKVMPWNRCGLILAGINGFHLYKNPIGTEQQTTRIIETSLKKMEFRQCIEELNNTNEETLTICFPNTAMRRNYFKWHKLEDNQLNSEFVTINVTQVKESQFFDRWGNEILAKYKTATSTIQCTNFITDTIIGSTVGNCPFLLPGLENKPLTRSAIGFIAAKMFGTGRELLRSELFSNTPDPEITYKPLLVKQSDPIRHFESNIEGVD